MNHVFSTPFDEALTEVERFGREKIEPGLISVSLISPRCRRAVAAMAVVTRHGDRLSRASAVADEMGVSASYAEMILTDLRRAGLVKGAKGPGGGYTLGRAATDITLHDIIAAGPAMEAKDVQPSWAWSFLAPILSDAVKRVMLAQLVTAGDLENTE